jgi:hypothetical protein
MKPLILLFLAISVLTVPCSAYGQRKADVPSLYALSPPDLNTTVLPRRYNGANPEAIFAALEKRSKASQKDEFETTAAYQARLVASQTEKLVGTFGLNDIIPVVLASESLYGIDSQYNADAEELAVKITARSAIIGVRADLDKRALDVKYDFHAPTEYVGVNGYGARVTVEKSTTYIYSLLFQNFNSYSFELPARFSASGSVVTRLKLSPIEAKKAKESLRALLLIRLQTPSTEKGYISKKPTIQDPKETFAVYHYLVADVEQVWIYNYETGQVYKRLLPRQSN